MTIQQRRNKTMNSEDFYQDTDSLLRNEPIKKKTLTWHEIPTWMQDNIYITDGYRPQSNSYLECVKSLGYLHNESGKTKKMTMSSTIVSKWLQLYSEYMESLVNIYSLCGSRCSLFISHTI